MSEPPPPDQARQQAAVDRAVAAGRAGDAPGMLRAVHESGILDGLARQLHRKWPALDYEQVEYLVGEAVDNLYQDLRVGKQVLNPVGLMCRVCDRAATDLRNMRRRERLDGADSVDGHVAPMHSSGLAAADPHADWDARRIGAIQLARSLLPRLGQQNIQAVMALHLDAIEQGRNELPAREIADALGLTPGTVRTSASRGFERLRRIAVEDGLATTLDMREFLPIESEEELDPA